LLSPFVVSFPIFYFAESLGPRGSTGKKIDLALIEYYTRPSVPILLASYSI